ncbi:MAG: tRNA (adenosine(37)-N6)-threonylcarbamoyltransferase complex ATPase subunit type 1 TsaE [Actinomycetota bacterium]
MISRTVRSLAETHALAAAIAGLAKVGDDILLPGDRGAGKTAFAQGFGRALGITEPITSPTFTVVHTYDTGRVVLHHADLYRLDRRSEVDDLGLDELTEGRGILLVEWGDVLAETFGDHLAILIERTDDSDDARRITIRSVDRRWETRWPKLEAAIGS